MVRNFSEEDMTSKILLSIVDKEYLGILDQLKWSNLHFLNDLVHLKPPISKLICYPHNTQSFQFV